MSEDTTLRIERVIDAPPDVVFRAWTTREAIEEWYQEHPGDVVRIFELDVRPGGRYHIEFGPPGEPPCVEHARYVEVDPPHRLVWVETIEHGGGGWKDTTVTVVFEEEDGKTRLTLVHEEFPSTEERDGAAGGWPGFLDRIERLVTHR